MGFRAIGRLSGRGLNGYYKGGAGTTTAQYGDTITYNVPGQPAGQIWLEQYVNGVLGYNGPFTIPMAPYTLSNKDQIGNWTSNAYALVGGQKGPLLETSHLYVTGAPVVQPITGSGAIPAATPGAGGGGGGQTQITINTAPSIPGALPSGAVVGASYNQKCLQVPYRFILATSGGYATGANRSGCTAVNSAPCDPQFFPDLLSAIAYAISNGEVPYKVDSAQEPWDLISCTISPDPSKIYDASGALAGTGIPWTLVIAAVAAVYFFGKSRRSS